MFSDNREEVLRGCGSRYSISHPLSRIHEVDRNKKYAFVGRPCDVMALRNYMKIDQELKNVIIFKLSFLCAGIPSDYVQKKLIDALKCKNGCKSLNYRGNGWPGGVYCCRWRGNIAFYELLGVMGGYLGRDVSKSCRVCFDGIRLAADITAGDAWYAKEDGSPDFTEREGRNIIFARSALGNKLIEKMSVEGDLAVENGKEYLATFRNIQSYQYRRRSTMSCKIAAMKLLFCPVPCYKKSILKSISKNATRYQRWVVFWGTVKRMLSGKI